MTGTYAVVEELAMRTDSLFGAHVTLSTSDENVPLETLNKVAVPTGNNWSVCCKANAQPLELPRITDYYGKLVLLLLDLVVQYSDASNCFMAAFYAFELATAFHDGLFVEPEDEDEPDILEQALVFGYDHVILCLVIEAACFLDKAEVTTKALFALESIISLAKEKVNKSCRYFAMPSLPISKKPRTLDK